MAHSLSVTYANATQAKLDDVSKILTDLRADLDTQKLSSQRTSALKLPLFNIYLTLVQSENKHLSSSRSMVETLTMQTLYSHKTYAGLAPRHEDMK